MKTNGKKAIIATMAIAMAAGIAGSISGTVAWFQYNTRVTSEFTGTTAKCTEFLQVRTIKDATGTVAKAKLANEAAVTAAAASYAEGDIVITDDFKVFTKGAESFGAGVAAVDGAKYDVNGTVYKYKAAAPAAWETITKDYGSWGTSLQNADILEAAGRANGKLAPVTAPGATVDGALPTLYGQPVCGYEQYAHGDYKWQTAETSDYMQFQLQFRVLDIDGKEANPNALIAQPLYLTDLTIAQKVTSPATSDISSAVRVHLAHDTTYAHIGKGTNAANISTVTTGSLDLNLDGHVDDERDVPGSHYSFNAADPENPVALQYGKDAGMGTSAAYSNLYAANGLYPTNDSVGHLEGGRALGTTDGTDVPATDAEYFTLTVTIYLEGWQPLEPANGAAAVTSPANTIWNSASYIGSEFNIGMSFGVTTLD